KIPGEADIDSSSRRRICKAVLSIEAPIEEPIDEGIKILLTNELIAGENFIDVPVQRKVTANQTFKPSEAQTDAQSSISPFYKSKVTLGQNNLFDGDLDILVG
ncbi:hypothetical protein U1Q18_049529, partial [Sarracenia purpurea var. burkii]